MANFVESDERSGRRKKSETLRLDAGRSEKMKEKAEEKEKKENTRDGSEKRDIAKRGERDRATTERIKYYIRIFL